MTWTADGVSDAEHEGYVAYVFPDGSIGSGRSDGGITVVGQASRSPDDVGAWIAQCVCGEWRGSIWQRTKFPARENIATRTLYVSGDDAGDLPSAREDVASIMRREWESHASPIAAAASVANAAAAVREANRELDETVAVARAMGASWELVGRAAGISRQAAHDRWREPR